VPASVLTPAQRRRIWLDATPEDRAVFSLTHPGVVEHASRTTAYEEQVCTR
jgi:hypothetical protein